MYSYMGLYLAKSICNKYHRKCFQIGGSCDPPDSNRDALTGMEKELLILANLKTKLDPAPI